MGLSVIRVSGNGLGPQGADDVERQEQIERLGGRSVLLEKALRVLMRHNLLEEFAVEPINDDARVHEDGEQWTI